MKKKWLLGLLMAGSLAFATGCAGGEAETEAEPSASESSASAPAEAPTPDLEGIPDVVAVVNGLEIPKDEFTAAYERAFEASSMQAQMSGQPVDQEQLKTQTLDNMIGTKLLLQEADKRGIAASDDAVTAATEELIANNQVETEEELFASLEERGIPKDEAQAQIKQQVQLDSLLAEEGADAKPSEDELKKIYEDGKAAAGEGAEVPPFEEVRAQIEQQAIENKKNEVAVALFTELRESGDVTTNL